MADMLKELLEAYDKSELPFNQESDAYDLEKEIDPLLWLRVAEEVDEQVDAVVKEAQDELTSAFSDQREGFSAAIEEKLLEGAAEDIIKLLDEHIPEGKP